MQPVAFTADERRWIRLKWEAIRGAQQTADQANREWQGLSKSIDSWLDSSGITDVVQRTKIKAENLGLKDALETGRWHAQNAQRHIDDLMCFLKMKDMGLL
jgi:hypothetical protein